MKALAARRHHRAAPVVLLLLALLVTGGVYAVLAPSPATAETASTATDVEEGQRLFQANCATCHGPNAEGTPEAPSLVGVGAAAVDFQVSTGRMPMQMSGPQAAQKPPQMNEEQTAQLAAYVASLGAGPAIPTEEQVDAELGDSANGALLFRTNCAMCHNAVGAGGALSEGKWAPPLDEVSEQNIYQAMLTGPQSMPVFNDANITPDEKRDVIAYLVEQRDGSAGGLTLGSLGPVSEGLWAWVVGLGLMIGAAVWIGAKSS
ncbi:menaquinol-cytochrome c reductase cytochrome c1 subunit precursor [Isoptericola sp. CG 20/1183]|uniref:Cytochrome bc1 complex cytochrome c subunit n=1 Tax=Isoptericola halotolerans TaxID=300560 RepID=A0ABX5ED90_9MICO|nr:MULTISPECIES: c-type cytochrome [Isoptericola]MCK0115686.1 c-type cytochrome [Isoptericola sp. S6320L]PRZ03897.1 menaquinol-cytochrome c reductase cytochrome c1 subunit precursor [Isoptericola sp. CG 20/1183]PRZ03970.1 menaquinol-cytochrome c reductase cytochrome c1 subunit precursor [Isoptericola halotolerans]